MIAEDSVAIVRRFNRFYTSRIGALNEAHLGSPFTLAEGRALYEAAQAPDGMAPAALSARTGIDDRDLDRALQRLRADGLIAPPSAGGLVRLTPKGRTACADIVLLSQRAMAGMIGGLSAGDRDRLSRAMAEIEGLLQAEAPGDVSLRPHRVGDMAWVIERHALFYAGLQGLDERFEALVARICADFIDRFDPARERCWIAERNGRRLGSIFLVKGEAPGQAKLRLLLVEPEARGLGLGRRLVSESIAFARACGYTEIVLWTQSTLTAARALYAAAGFELTQSEPYRDLGPELITETWRLLL